MISTLSFLMSIVLTISFADSPSAFEESKVYLEQAKKIIDSDPKLVIRKQQLQSLR